MKKMLIRLSLVLSLLIAENTLAQTTPPNQKMSVNDRLIKARAAKVAKKETKATGNDASTVTAGATEKNAQPGYKAASVAPKVEKATPADYKTPIDKSQQGPNGEVVHTGARGGKYYINKNGNKTYLSSNQ